MHPLLSPILDGFLNNNQSPEDLADQHKLSVREVLDLLLSDDAAKILLRLEQVEELRQSVLAARARSKAFATLDYLTLFDRHAKHNDCDLRRRVSEAILKQTSKEAPFRRAPSSPRDPQKLPDLLRLRAARLAAEDSADAKLEDSVRRSELSLSSMSSASINLPNPSPLFETPSQRAAHRRSSPLHLNPSETAAKLAARMNTASCNAHAQTGGSCRCAAPDDG